ncbi:MAG TPA: nitroreductase family protein [Armatimonadota bacterium]
MAIKTGRTEGTVAIAIDGERCTRCGLCVSVCCGAPLYMRDGAVQVDHSRFLGCIGCGHCMAVCPRQAITVTGRDLQPDDLFSLPDPAEYATFPQLQSLLLSRRSVRHFQPREVEREVIDAIITAASTAPMGIPPTEVGVLVLENREKVQEFKDDLLRGLRASRWMFAGWLHPLWRLLVGKEAADLMTSFVGPAVDAYEAKDREGEDWFFYNAPLAIHFYTTPSGDAADPVIAATCAMLAAQALGLGSCMLGFPGYVIKSSKTIRRKYGLPTRLQPGMVLIFGYPAIPFRQGIHRRFADVHFWERTEI